MRSASTRAPPPDGSPRRSNLDICGTWRTARDDRRGSPSASRCRSRCRLAFGRGVALLQCCSGGCTRAPLPPREAGTGCKPESDLDRCFADPAAPLSGNLPLRECRGRGFSMTTTWAGCLALEAVLARSGPLLPVRRLEGNSARLASWREAHAQGWGDPMAGAGRQVAGDLSLLGRCAGVNRGSRAFHPACSRRPHADSARSLVSEQERIAFDCSQTC